MAVLVGIDEAGYGPLLGPLVVSSAAFSMPEELLKADHWKVLSRAVGREKKGLAGRLVITDSKKAYSRAAGVEQLRRTVLACVYAMDRCSAVPATVGELLDALNSSYAAGLEGCPWYKSLPEMGLGGEREGVEIASTVLANTLSGKGIRLLDMTCRVMEVRDFNRMVSAVKNKAGVLFTVVAGLISDAFYKGYGPASEGVLQVIVDRQGGRMDYVPVLRKMFAGLDLRVIRQDERLCSYELTGRGRAMRLHFAVKADDRYLPVALASMVSKYVRELFVESLNAYFVRRCAGLRPTAGYWQDGQRFVKDLERYRHELGYDSDMLIRQR
ncbi:MAG TPA: hypothetical protein P5279_04850 [Anaerohalosphaeraceae bacterium]|nr:hypothetical protein [Anaerohalosphaeraceae bacterium]HRT49799.1 hypothetical protein [Anaerohalosphaeraceae bacterium]HRT85541.1 hypothetical protein [Anaerohalosphaeraceae bacterium]